MSELGIDVASYQSVAQVIGEVKAGRATFVFVKATEGLGYVNPLYARQVAAARANGAKVGHYHFAHCANDPVAEARYFLAHADIRVGDAIMLDLEYQGDGSSWPKRASYAAAWLSFVAVTERCHPIRYVNQNWLIGILNAAQQAQRQVFEAMPLMIAAPGAPGKPGIIQPWAVHQYATTGGIDRDLLVVPWDSFAVQPVGSVTPTNSTVGVDDMSAADVAAINAHIDAVITQVFASLSHGTLPDGSKANGTGHDQILAAIQALPAAQPGPAPAAAALSDADKDDIAQRVANLLAARLQS